MTTRVCRGERDGLLRGMGVFLSAKFMTMGVFQLKSWGERACIKMVVSNE